MESFKKSQHWWFYPSSGRWSSPSTFCIYNIFILLLQLSSPFCQLFSARSKYCYALLTSMMRASCSMTVAATPPRRSILFRPWPGHLTRFRTYRWDYFLLWLHFFWLDVAIPLLHLLSVWLLHIFGQNLESWHPLQSPRFIVESFPLAFYVLSTFIALWIMRRVRASQSWWRCAYAMLDLPPSIRWHSSIIAINGLSIVPMTWPGVLSCVKVKWCAII